MHRARSSYLVTCFALSSLAALFAYGASIPKQDSVWKRYYNSNAAYCVSYPSRWYKADAFDGSGLYVMSGVKKHSRATGEIDIAVFRNPAIGQARATNISLKDDFESHVDGLKKFERAERIEVLEQRPMEVAGSSGLFTKDKYYDPQDRSTWVEEVLFVQRKDEIYRVELECKADQAGRFEAVFSHLVSTLEFDCPSPR
jgi:hypothetical protein